MNATQFAWLYLIKNGFAGVQHSYYGGYKVDKNEPFNEEMFNKYDGSWSWFIKAKDDYIDLIKKIGVNWKKTKAPESSSVSKFQGTFADSKEVEMLEGTLVLKNGQRIEWIADAIEVTSVFEMMANAANGQVEYNELFGEAK